MLAVLSFLGGWLLAILRAAVSALVEAAKTPLGAAAITIAVVYPLGHHAGWSESEARHARAAEMARAVAEARTESDRETARAEQQSLTASAAARAAILEEITHAPLPQPRPGEPCLFDARRLR